MDDIRTVVWKEWHTVFRARQDRKRVLVTLLSPIALAIYLPFSAGSVFFTGYYSIVPSLAIPIILIVLLIPDSFAGELERHTLPTLLSTRLPERSIILGKLLVTGVIAWGAALLGLVVGLLVVLVTANDLQQHFYNFDVLFADVIISFAIVVLISTVGISISLRTKTVQEASQLLVMIFTMPPVIGGFILVSIMRSNESAKDSTFDVLNSLATPAGTAAIALVFIGIAAIMYRRALRRFSRERLSSGQ